MTWVPPYAVTTCQARLSETYGGAGMADALTHLALQFWVPTRQGGLARAGRTNATTDAAIAALKDWGRTNGVRVLLCVFNGGGESWDWSLAQAGFAEHADGFIEALLAEVKRHDLDGVDLDLEGKSEFQEDRERFVAFVRRLSDRLHREGYQLTVDSFAYKWNVPNHSWWPDLLPHVDGLTTMGYAQTGFDAPKWRGYAFQKAAAGDHAHKLMIGLPSHRDEWQGRALMEHLEWLRDSGCVGVSFWDAQLRAPAWRQPEVWRTLRHIREGS
jgi:spore germination protein YaaH